MKIFKYPLLLQERDSVVMPKGAKILSAQSQYGVICLWALVEPEADVGTRTFRIYGTGHEIEAEALEFIATVQQGSFVWHVFEEGQQGSFVWDVPEEGS